jgi:hypothetical protein
VEIENMVYMMSGQFQVFGRVGTRWLCVDNLL